MPDLIAIGKMLRA